MTDKKLISAPYATDFHKRNVLWGIVFASIIAAILAFLTAADDPVGGVIMAAVLILFGIGWGIYSQTRGQSLVDEVYDCGDFLLIRNAGQGQEYLFTQIVSMRLATGAPARPDNVVYAVLLKMKDGTKIRFMMPVFTYHADKDLRRRLKNKA
ncbi:MAG: hypothetical protein FWH15_05490 [Betaproteobacteria bacterium]|nr:hypothetical protein [Betaproteobacteria bacterium]